MYHPIKCSNQFVTTTMVFSSACVSHHTISHLSPLVLSGEESGEEDGEEEGTELSLKAQQEKLEAEKQSIMQNKDLLNEVSVVGIHLWVILYTKWQSFI